MNRLVHFGLAGALLVLGACSDEGSGLPTEATTAVVSFAADVQPIFDAHCGPF